jgi:hypothetical protein
LKQWGASGDIIGITPILETAWKTGDTSWTGFRAAVKFRRI